MSHRLPSDQRQPSDMYPTPYEFCQRIVTTLIENGGDYTEDRPLRFLEPGCGDAPFCRAIKEAMGDRVETTGVETRNVLRRGWVDALYSETDFLTPNKYINRFNIIMTNPPFSLAREFLAASIRMCKPTARIIFLLRLAWLESATRLDRVHRKIFPSMVYVLPDRPKFINNKTDSSAYAFFVYDLSQQSTLNHGCQLSLLTK